ncbi:hypothetical protein PC113_g20516 [Phytophthora cactorum]|uniref:Uncharacterized protein n=1 Tax=Phytophthora cactorum TaxID=29920 RepID=A0A8T0YGA0_9STRA|nr:hypothetical protein PC113_g20516 [Phytophthora cactorum]
MEGLNQSKLRNFNLRVSLPDLAVSEKSQEMLQQPPGSSPGRQRRERSSLGLRSKESRNGAIASKFLQAEFEDVDPSHDDVVPAAFVTSEMGGFSMTYHGYKAIGASSQL